MPAVLNAANEVAVNAFLNGKIRLSEIVEINESVMAAHQNSSSVDLSTILETDRAARSRAADFVRGKSAVPV